MNRFLIAAGVAFGATVFSFSTLATNGDAVRGQRVIGDHAVCHSAGSFQTSADREQEAHVAPYPTEQLLMGGVSQPRTRMKGEKSAMDMWEFLKWRRTLRYTQAEAAEKLGVNRGTIQNWERGHTRIPKSTELACHELTRQWKQRPEF